MEIGDPEKEGRRSGRGKRPIVLLVLYNLLWHILLGIIRTSGGGGSYHRYMISGKGTKAIMAKYYGVELGGRSDIQ